MNKLKKLREKAILTQIRLSQKSGVSLGEIKKMETESVNLKKCRYESLEKIANVLECEIKDLF